MIVKPIRHVTHVADLDANESAELGALLAQTTRAVTELSSPDQVYVCLWSHADRKPGHIHFVVQPVGAELMQRFDAHGPALQMAMFQSNLAPPVNEIEAFARRAAEWFSRQSSAA